MSKINQSQNTNKGSRLNWLLGENIDFQEYDRQVRENLRQQEEAERKRQEELKKQQEEEIAQRKNNMSFGNTIQESVSPKKTEPIKMNEQPNNNLISDTIQGSINARQDHTKQAIEQDKINKISQESRLSPTQSKKNTFANFNSWNNTIEENINARQNYTKSLSANKNQNEAKANQDEYNKYVQIGKNYNKNHATWYDKMLGRNTSTKNKVEYILNMDFSMADSNDELADIQYQKDKYSSLTNAERNEYNYLFGKYGEEKANDYLKKLDSELNKRIGQKYEKQAEEKANKNKLWGTANAILTSPFGALGAIDKTVQHITNKENNIDSYNKLGLISRTGNAATKGLTKDMGNVSSFLTNTGLSIGQNLATRAFTGGNEAATLAAMGLSAMDKKFIENSEKGIDDNRNMLSSAISGGIEVATEKFPFDNLLKVAKVPKSGIKATVKEVLKQSGVEGLEEAVSEIANNVADERILGDKADSTQYYNSLVESGMNKNDARIKELTQYYLINPAISGLGGFISGGVMGSGGMVVNNANMKLVGNEIKKSNQDFQLVVDSINGQYGDEAKNYAVQLMNNEIKNGKEVSDADIGRLFAYGTIYNQKATKKNNNSEAVTSTLKQENIKTYAPENASDSIKSLENSLIKKGASDLDRQNVILTATDTEKTLANSDKNIKQVSNGISVITDNVSSEMKNSTGGKPNYWNLFNANLKAVTNPQDIVSNDNFVREYASEFAAVLQANNSDTYNSIASDGKYAVDVISDYVMSGKLPDNAANNKHVVDTLDTFKGIVETATKQINKAHEQIYGVQNTDNAVTVQNVQPATNAVQDNTVADSSSGITPVQPTANRTISLTKVGDFYEAYGNDAAELAGKLNLSPTTKTINGEKVQMVGFPTTALDNYKSRLGSGYDVEISDNSHDLSADSEKTNNELSVYDTLDNLGLTHDEQRAILNYKSSESYNINELLYSGEELSETDIKMIGNLNNALEKFPIYKGKVYRNISFDFQGQEEFEKFINEHTEGKIISYPAFTSASKSADGYIVGGELLVHMEINNISGRDVSDIGIAEEQEVLFKTNSSFKASSVTYYGKAVNIILEEVSNGTNNKGKDETTGEFKNDRKHSEKFEGKGEQVERIGRHEEIFGSSSIVRERGTANDSISGQQSEHNKGTSGKSVFSNNTEHDERIGHDSDRTGLPVRTLNNDESDRTDKEEGNKRNIESKSSNTHNKRPNQEIYNKNDSVREGSTENANVFGEQSAGNGEGNRNRTIADSGRTTHSNRDATLSEGVAVRINQNDTLIDKCELIQTKNTKTGEDLWVIKPNDRISKEEYNELKGKVKALGGYYSPFAQTPEGRKIPGFIFKQEPTADVISVFNDFFGTSSVDSSENTKSDANENISENDNTAKPISNANTDSSFSGKQLNLAVNTLSKALNIPIRVVSTITDGRGHKANGFFNGKEIVIAKDSDQPIINVIKHEITHQLKKQSPKLYQEYCDYVIAALKQNGIYEALFDDYTALYGTHLTEDAIQEEIVAEATETFLSDEKAINELAKEKPTLAKKVLAVIRDIIAKIQGIINSNATNDVATSLTINQLEQAEKLWVNALANVIETKKNNTKVETKYSSGKNESRIYDYTKSFAEQINDWKQGLIPQNDSLLVSGTPEVLKKTGFNALPITINQKHIDYAINGTKDVDHHLGETLLKQLPQALENPVAIISSQTQPNRVIAILKMQHNGKNVITPVEIDGYGTQNNLTIDSNAVVSIFGKDNAITKQLKNALIDEANNKTSMFYWNKKEALSLLQRPGLRLPNPLPQDGFIHNITEKNSSVKPKIKNATYSQQFKRWFGDWENNPKKASKVVNADGTPKIMYHGSGADFTVFDKKKAKYSGMFGRGFYFTDSKSHAGTYGKLYEVYLDVKNPVDDKTKVTNQQLRNFLEAVAEDEDYSIENYGTYDIDEIIPKINQDSLFTVLRDVSSTAIGDMVEATELFNKVNGTNYDGIFSDTEYVVFKPNQIKSATDNIGTFDKGNDDIRFSLSKPVEETNDLIKKNDVEKSSNDDIIKETERGNENGRDRQKRVTNGFDSERRNDDKTNETLRNAGRKDSTSNMGEQRSEVSGIGRSDKEVLRENESGRKSGYGYVKENARVVKKNGKAINVYHGTPYTFSHFEKPYADIGIHFGTKEQAAARLKNENNKKIITADLVMKNPLVVYDDIFGERSSEEYLNDIIKNAELSQDEVNYITEKFNNFSDTKLQENARVSLLKKLSGVYDLEFEAEEDGIYVSMYLTDDIGKKNYIPKSDIIDIETLKNTLSKEDFIELYSGNRISEIAEDTLRQLGFDLFTGIEGEYLKLRNIEQSLKDLGYDGLIYPNKNEGHGVSYAVFDNEQITINNTENEPSYQLKKQLTLEEENAKLKEVNESLKKQLKLSDGIEVKRSQVLRTAKKIIKEYSSEYNVQKLNDELTGIFDKLANNNQSEESFATALEELNNVMTGVLEKSKVLDTTVYDLYKNLRKELRSVRINVSDNVKADFGSKTNYEFFRKSMFGKLNLSNEGVEIDSFYDELSNEYPELFDSNIINPTDQLLRIADILEGLQPVYYNPYNMSISEIANDMAYNALAEYAIMKNEAPTFADKKKAELDKVKNLMKLRIVQVREQYRTKNAENLAKQKKKHKLLMEQLRTDARLKIEDLKNEYKRQIAELRADKNSKKHDAVSAEKAKSAAKLKKLKEDTELKIEAVKAQYKERIEKIRLINAGKIAVQTEKFTNYRNRQREKAAVKKFKAKIKDDFNTLSKWLLKPTDTQHIPEGLRKSIANFLSIIDISANDKDSKVNERLRSLEREFLKVQAEPETASQLETLDPDFLPRLTEFIDILGDNIFQIQDMNSTQLKELAYFTKVIRHCVVEANKLLAGNKKAEISDYGIKSMNDMAKHKVHNEKSGLVGKADKLLNMDMLAAVDYFEELGNTMSELYMNIRKGFDKKVDNVHRTQEYIKKLLNGTDVSKWTGEKAKVYTFKLSGGEIKLSTAQIMSLYLQNKREQAIKHIYSGGIKQAPIIVKENGIHKIKKSYAPIQVTPADVNKIISTLTAEQTKIADGIGNFMSTVCSDWGNEVSMELYGYKKFKEDNYFPIVSDDNYIATNFSDGGEATLKNMGFTKATIKNANNPIIIEDIFDVFCTHTDKMSSYNAFVLPLSDIQRVYNYKDDTGSVKQAIERAFGKKANDYFKMLIKDINGISNHTGDRWIDKAISNYKAATISANMRVVIQQPTALVRAAALIDAKYLAGGLIGKVDFELVKKYAPIARWKDWGYFETDTGRQLKDIILDKEKITDKMMSLASKADNLAWARLWNAVELEIKDTKPELEKGSDAFYRAVGERFSYIVDKTQVVDTVLHRPQIMRSKDSATKMATAYMSEPLKSYNLLRTAIKKAMVSGDKKDIKQALRTVIAYISTEITTAMFAAIIDAMRDKDKEKNYIQKWCGHAIENALSSPAGMIPYLRDIVSIAEGYDVERMDMSGWGDIANSLLLIKSDKYNLPYKLQHLAGSVGKVVGIPASNILRTGSSIANCGINIISAFGGDTSYLDYLKTKFVYGSNSMSENNFETIIDMRNKFNKNEDSSIKSQALADAKKYIKKGDKKKAAEAINNYFEYGGKIDGIINSFDRLNPLYGMGAKKNEKRPQESVVRQMMQEYGVSKDDVTMAFLEFESSLSNNDKKKFKSAIKYYKSNLELTDAEKKKLKSIKNKEQAKNVFIEMIGE